MFMMTTMMMIMLMIIIIIIIISIIIIIIIIIFIMLFFDRLESQYTGALERSQIIKDELILERQNNEELKYEQW